MQAGIQYLRMVTQGPIPMVTITHNDDDDLLAIHDEMASMLDHKLSAMPEWRTFRRVDRMLLRRIGTAPVAAPVQVAPKIERKRIQPELFGDAPIPYMTLAANALTETGQPITTVDLMDYIGKRRTITGDPKKARIVVQSSLSKDERFRSIPWNGGRAWWWKNQPPPQKKTAA